MLKQRITYHGLDHGEDIRVLVRRHRSTERIYYHGDTCSPYGGIRRALSGSRCHDAFLASFRRWRSKTRDISIVNSSPPTFTGNRTRDSDRANRYPLPFETGFARLVDFVQISFKLSKARNTRFGMFIIFFIIYLSLVGQTKRSISFFIYRFLNI